MFPKPSPDGIALSIQDITAQWPEDWKGTFDYVHQRLGLAGIGQHPLKDIVHRQCELLKPGGWIEFVELDIAPNSNPAVEKLFSLVRELIDMIGNGWNYVSTLKGALEQAGLESVEDKSIDVFLGASASSPELREKSIISMQFTTSAFVDVVDSK
ncbi:uncharacterized protein EI97DRAFT_430352 [Westerdykella ornata]|uniref:Methyltransferase type 11 domain-containing protein n=1 Tax=Westerdykella ornata TaxID=318751 RepID=A0A6A6JT11_WESOR|nr:uncharacterized protein EI97DRAFT_430352 [Westerdykella ornata]KAF2279253.1 hypothetical protein EI97DRAFT_430352 [Westerdykella ornata]